MLRTRCARRRRRGCAMRRDDDRRGPRPRARPRRGAITSRRSSSVERLELVDLRARQQRRVDLEVRVLRRRADQRDDALLDRGQQRVLLRLVEAVDLVEEQDRALAVRAEPLACAREHLAHLADRRRHRRQLLERSAGHASRRSARASSCRCPAGRRRSSSRRGPARSPAAAPSPRRARARCPTNSSSDCGRTRSASGATPGRRSSRGVGEEVAHAPEKYAPQARGDRDVDEDFSAADPARQGARRTTSDTCARTSCSRCRRRPRRWRIRDELLFQTVHQSSELWLKLACFEVETRDCASARRRARRGSAAARGARSLCLQVHRRSQLDMLEHMSPWEYQTIRRVLGHGSGFDSPGFRKVRRVSPPLGEAFDALRSRGRPRRSSRSTSRGASSRSSTSSPRR